MTTIEPQRPTRDEVRDLVKECGLDWQRGFAPLFDGDDTNRYEVLVRAAIEQYAAAAVLAERERCARVCDRTLRDHYASQRRPASEEVFLFAAVCDCAAAIRAEPIPVAKGWRHA